jgi:hypothetical protein
MELDGEVFRNVDLGMKAMGSHSWYGAMDHHDHTNIWRLECKVYLLWGFSFHALPTLTLTHLPQSQEASMGEHALVLGSLPPVTLAPLACLLVFSHWGTRKGMGGQTKTPPRKHGWQLRMGSSERNPKEARLARLKVTW